MQERKYQSPGFLARSNDDPAKVFGVAISVALTCSLLVSGATAYLRPVQEANLAAEREARMAAMVDAVPGLRDIIAESGADGLETRMVDLSTGQFVPGAETAGFDYDAAASSEDIATTIPGDRDLARLRTRPSQIPVNIVEKDGELLLVVLPMRGRGYQSVISAVMALESDLTTVAALRILEQAETAGLGARIETPEWQASWVGKQVAGTDGTIMIDVVRGGASTSFEVDGISGATVTSQGVANMVRYWLGDHGFGPFIERLRAEGG
ncbi:Na+-transporting NADH:ubiquinone oxidoreductase subunit C [Hoeflea halophila]|uniref:Na(+)-translocating NADH-quinone reductase subunit C n=1 Tax=Hoeflea halophila TaxID=714899 RepID=A0A286IF07_9HYPH|nr:NADH:ubiquinone reductase (Na(+)-transporting) subunit C [Hoeflea halophila]SOE18236.1 Na+-transporting NADH:ubiquinone oxidoreductase subunit C [Hoeflea halophila]